MLLPLGAVKASQHLKKWKRYIYICKWAVWTHDKDMKQLFTLWKTDVGITSCLASQTADLHLTTEDGSEEAFPSVMGLCTVFIFFKVCWNLTSNKSLYVLCLLYWNGGKIGLLSNKYWLVPPTLPWSNTSWDSFKNWSQHHKRAVKVSISGSLLERHSRTSCPQNWDLLLVNLAFLSPFILAC